MKPENPHRQECLCHSGAHADVEWVDLESVMQLAEILAETAVAYCS